MSRVRRVLEGHNAVTTASVNLATETALVRVLVSDLHAPLGHEGALEAISGELAAVCRFYWLMYIEIVGFCCILSSCSLHVPTMMHKQCTLTFFIVIMTFMSVCVVVLI